MPSGADSETQEMMAPVVCEHCSFSVGDAANINRCPRCWRPLNSNSTASVTNPELVFAEATSVEEKPETVEIDSLEEAAQLCLSGVDENDELNDFRSRLKRCFAGYGVSFAFHVLLMLLAALFVYQNQRFDWNEAIDSSMHDGLDAFGSAGGLQPTIPIQLDMATELTPSPLDNAAYQAAINNSGNSGNSQGTGDGGIGFFGTSSRGHSFVFVVDISGSMTAHYEEPDPEDSRVTRILTRWDKAREELLTSIAAMEDDQSFCVVLYNDRHLPMREFGEPVGMLRATPTNKRKLDLWLNSIQAGGGTNPVESLKYALSLQPDVVFLLTDGEIPPQSREVSILFNRRKTVIHTTCIGYSQNDLLQLIAADHRGQFRTVSDRGESSTPEGVMLMIFVSDETNRRLKYSRLEKHRERIAGYLQKSEVELQQPNTHSILTLHNATTSVSEFNQELQRLLRSLNTDGKAGYQQTIHPGLLGVGVALGAKPINLTDEVVNGQRQDSTRVEQLLKTQVSASDLKSFPQAVKTIYLFGDIAAKRELMSTLEIFDLYNGSQIRVIDGDEFVRENR